MRDERRKISYLIKTIRHQILKKENNKWQVKQPIMKKQLNGIN